MTPEACGAEDFLASAMVPGSPLTPDASAFLDERHRSASYEVERVPLAALPQWRLGERLGHVSGRFFEVEGLSVRTDFGPVPQWCQPIIVQPEIGILGILAKRFDGVLHFLMQAKMEPGNSSFVQYAATVQATPSNYQRVHGGRSTPYLDYFMQGTRRRVLFDQLLSEHASWYLFKRNRNMIVEVREDEEVPVEGDFAWLTLGQLRDQLGLGNRVNMNARTVLSGISYGTPGSGRPSPKSLRGGFRSDVLESHRTPGSAVDLSGVSTWLIDQKARFSLDARRIGLREMDGWICDDDSIRHRDGRHFEIIGVSVRATSREVGAWWQPMLEPCAGNVVALICQRRAGVLRFLAQAMVQPGLTDRLELGPSVQFVPGAYRGPQDHPPLTEYLRAPESWIRLRTVQSEDGGRFSRADTLHVVIQLPEDHEIEVPDNYRWMTLGLLNRMNRLGYHLNVEVRSLAACLL
ncbi:NDP-hexose 2,3-dehydratase family protein [Streptomyces sp. BE147]|uniref:NDP-hexose 2,3-dehydratase family protein n=1 Tax=Streptomyces sp. BE147 TaxID=3002524 RepID=UPI002E7A2ACE|nr:NDP-hexose 2,3-dehydratase family protein [Streptomyces sp. BE147]MEE1742652.1 NDP-hexose 2,3-dehydratase family protein [Streptomyces sp. BE147]